MLRKTWDTACRYHSGNGQCCRAVLLIHRASVPRWPASFEQGYLGAWVRAFRQANPDRDAGPHPFLGEMLS